MKSSYRYKVSIIGVTCDNDNNSPMLAKLFKIVHVCFVKCTKYEESSKKNKRRNPVFYPPPLFYNKGVGCFFFFFYPFSCWFRLGQG